MSGDTSNTTAGEGLRPRRGRPPKVKMEDALLQDGELGFDARDKEKINQLRRILRGEYVRSVGSVLTRDIVACKLIRWAFGPGVPLNYAMAAMNSLVQLLRLDKVQDEEIGVRPVLLGSWEDRPSEAELEELKRRDAEADREIAAVEGEL